MTLESAFDIAASGLNAHADRMQIHAQNMANVDTPKFVRRIPVLMENQTMMFEDVLTEMRKGIVHAGLSASTGGVSVETLYDDPTPGKKIKMPGHPLADADGFVTLSNVNPMAEMADATLASRLYEANLSVVNTVKAMASKAMEIGRGQ
jgi:flagellar basal-body rod protein FlgC